MRTTNDKKAREVFKRVLRVPQSTQLSPRAMFDMSMLNVVHRLFAKEEPTQEWWRSVYGREFPLLTAEQLMFWREYSNDSWEDVVGYLSKHVYVNIDSNRYLGDSTRRPLSPYSFDPYQPTVLLFSGNVGSLTAAMGVNTGVPIVFVPGMHQHWTTSPHTAQAFIIASSSFRSQTILLGSRMPNSFTDSWKKYTGMVVTCVNGEDRSQLFKRLADTACLPFVHTCAADFMNKAEATHCGSCYGCFETWHMCHAFGFKPPFKAAFDEHDSTHYVESSRNYGTFAELEFYAEYNIELETNEVMFNKPYDAVEEVGVYDPSSEPHVEMYGTIDPNSIKAFQIRRGCSPVNPQGFIAAVGTIMPSGQCVMEWTEGTRGIQQYASIDELRHFHGHGKTTTIVFGSIEH